MIHEICTLHPKSHSIYCLVKRSKVDALSRNDEMKLETDLKNITTLLTKHSSHAIIQSRETLANWS